MAQNEFRRLVFSFTQDGYIVDREKSGVREMGRILNILSDRRDADPAYKPFVLAQADQMLHRAGDRELFAISPSPGSVEKALAEISAMWASLESRARITLAPPERNHNSSPPSCWSSSSWCNTLRSWVRGYKQRRAN
jgi:hypothetical protein